MVLWLNATIHFWSGQCLPQLEIQNNDECLAIDVKCEVEIARQKESITAQMKQINSTFWNSAAKYEHRLVLMYIMIDVSSDQEEEWVRWLSGTSAADLSPSMAIHLKAPIISDTPSESLKN